ncbi:MAG: transcriptional regulator [Thermodesulfobacteriota bacterium]|nr:transcriptional regulator [Thermodesulfobacteriota bacterium]
MADELGSGMRKMMRYCKAFGGEDPEMIEGDVFRIVVKVPEFGKQAPKDILLRPESGVESDMTAHVLSMLHQEVLSKSAIAKNLGKEKPSRYLNDLMRQLIEKEMVEYTIPDKPKSRLQKYRLTGKGKQFLSLDV